MVADALRSRILSGALQDGEFIGKQEELLTEFNVSKPSIREALRILETEGLVSVQRGSMGGAVVHVPHTVDAGYMLALVLESRGGTLDDIGAALKQLEPLCAGLCATRADRHETIVPALRAVQEDARANVGDVYALAMHARRFHETLVARCGSETMIVLVGAMESLWTAHQQQWAERVVQDGAEPEPKRRLEALRMHDRILELIDRGEADKVSRLARAHLETSILYALSDTERKPVRAALLRHQPLT
jgi:DNA-binding FadR family transcriptional regulator